jgi:flagellar motility protein MotE (MotC chaperone)
MRYFLLICLIVLIPLSVSTASSHNDEKEKSYKYSDHEKRHEDLKDQLYELKYDLRQQIRYQNKTIDEQAEIIREMRLTIKDLESNLFQTTQSLRNLELEVWDMKKSSNN